MGCYVNPPSGTKEEWLKANAKRWTSAIPFTWAHVPPGHLPVCLIDNGPFTAAGVAYCEAEFKEFSRPGDARTKIWWLASIEKLKEVSPVESYLKQEAAAPKEEARNPLYEPKANDPLPADITENPELAASYILARVWGTAKSLDADLVALQKKHVMNPADYAMGVMAWTVAMMVATGLPEEVAIPIIADLYRYAEDKALALKLLATVEQRKAARNN